MKWPRWRRGEGADGEVGRVFSRDAEKSFNY